MVTQDVAQFGGGNVPVHLAQVIEALAALGGLGPGSDGQRTVELHGHVGSVDHGTLGGAGVHREAVHRHGGRRGVEVLVLDGTGVAAVHGVGKVGPEARDIEQLSPLADLLVRGEGDAQLAVGQALFLQRFHSGQNFGDAGLVVGTQQGGAVRGDEGLALHAAQEGEDRGLHHHAGGGQGHLAAVVVLPHDGLHVLTAGVVGGVHVRDQAQGMLVFAARGGGQSAVDIAVLVHTGILQAKCFHLLHQLTGEVELPRRRRMGAGVFVRGGVHPDIVQKPFISAHKAHSFLIY